MAVSLGKDMYAKFVTQLFWKSEQILQYVSFSNILMICLYVYHICLYLYIYVYISHVVYIIFMLIDVTVMIISSFAL